MHLIRMDAEPNPRFTMAMILLAAERRPLQALVRPQAEVRDGQLPTISSNPSTISSNSSGVMAPTLLLKRSTDSVRIWLILTHERLGNRAEVISIVSGKPAVGS